MAEKECCLKGHGACSGKLNAIMLSDGIWQVCYVHGLIAITAAWCQRTGN